MHFLLLRSHLVAAQPLVEARMRAFRVRGVVRVLAILRMHGGEQYTNGDAARTATPKAGVVLSSQMLSDSLLLRTLPRLLPRLLRMPGPTSRRRALLRSGPRRAHARRRSPESSRCGGAGSVSQDLDAGCPPHVETALCCIGVSHTPTCVEQAVVCSHISAHTLTSEG